MCNVHTVEQNVVGTHNSDTTPDGKFSSVLPGESKNHGLGYTRKIKLWYHKDGVPVHPNFTPKCNYLATLCMSNKQDLYPNTICTNVLVPSTHIMSLLSISGLTAIYYEQIV